MKAILEKQREYFRSGSTRSIGFRLAALKTLRNAIISSYDKIVSAFAEDYNKSEFDAATTEIAMVVGEIDYMTKKLRGFVRPKRTRTSLANFPSRGYIFPEPYGCVLVVAPWNYPFNLSLSPLVGAVAAGNTVILKLSGKTPRVSQAITDLLSVFEERFIAVEPLSKRGMDIYDLKFDYLFYTGSAAFARRIAELQAKHLTPMSLELGGKSPCVVDKSSNLEIAAKRIAWGKFLNAGQTCVAPDFVVVHTDVAERFLDLLKHYTEKFYPEKSLENHTFTITEEKTLQLLESIKGEHIILGGYAKGRALAPTIVRDATFFSPVMQEEIFGAVLPVIEFDDLDTLAGKLADLPKPLALYFFGEKKLAERFCEKVPSGGVCVNDVIMQITEHSLPFGGVGESGMGRYHGKLSFDTFSHFKSVLIRRRAELNVKYPPHTEKKLRFVKRFFKLGGKKR